MRDFILTVDDDGGIKFRTMILDLYKLCLTYPV